MSDLKTKIVALTRDFRIAGEIDLVRGARLTDYMNEAKRFVVITDAKVCDHDGKELLQAQFLDVQLRNIEIVFPAENEV